MAENKVTTYYKIDGVDKAIKDQKDLAEAVGEVNEEFDDGKKSSKGFFAGIKGKGVGAFKALKGAIAATGIGLLLTAFAQLVEWFKQSDTGAKILQGTTAALGAIWEQLQNIFLDVIDLFKPLFEDPLGSIKAFGQAIVDNIVGRFNALLDTIGFLGTALKQLFEGDFSGALESATSAADSLINGVVGLDDIVEGVTSTVSAFGEAATKVFNDTAKAVVAAVQASNRFIDAQNELRKLNQDLLIENAQLNQQLETQQKIADDTTRAYEERKAALDEVNKANEELADNAVRLAAKEKEVGELALQNAKTDEERREAKDALAEAEAALIEAETAAQIVRLESAQLNRELDLEEAERKTAIAQQIEDLANANIEKERERELAAIDLAEQRTLEELEKLRATEEEKEAVREEFRKQRLAANKKFAEEDKKIDDDLERAKFDIAVRGLQALSALSAAFASEDEAKARKNFRIQKALSLATAAISNTEAVINAYKTAQASPITLLNPAYPAIQAGLAAAFGVAQIATIARQKFNPGAESPPPGPQVNGGAAGAGAAGNFLGAVDNFNQQEADITSIGQGGPAPVRAYVVATEVTDAQEANKNIEDLAVL